MRPINRVLIINLRVLNPKKETTVSIVVIVCRAENRIIIAIFSVTCWFLSVLVESNK